MKQARILPIAVFLSASIVIPPAANAQTYPVDCAILLCLSGGWPASVPCARARAVFIARITPWPITPPLQIWRCPMGIRYDEPASRSPMERFYDISANTRQDEPLADIPFVEPAVLRRPYAFPLLPDDNQIYQVQSEGDGADIDISDPTFDFVRSIRVFHVVARQGEEGRAGEEECERRSMARVGTYDTQGRYVWSNSEFEDLPDAFVGGEGFGDRCPDVRVRSVFIEWRDFEGNYDFEQVDY